MTEEQLQKKVAKMLDLSGLTWMHSPNEGKRHPAAGKRLKDQGLKAGVPDVLVFDEPCETHPMLEYRGLSIELKVGRNKPTASQLEWHEKLRRCGWRVEVCYTFDAVMDILRECYPNKFP